MTPPAALTPGALDEIEFNLTEALGSGHRWMPVPLDDVAALIASARDAERYRNECNHLTNALHEAHAELDRFVDAGGEHLASGSPAERIRVITGSLATKLGEAERVIDVARRFRLAEYGSESERVAHSEFVLVLDAFDRKGGAR